MFQNESIERINSYLDDYKQGKIVENTHNNIFFNDIIKNIYFKNKAEKKTFNYYSTKTNLSKIEVLHCPIDIELMREKLKHDYEVIHDDTSNDFYTLIYGTKNILIQYIVLLPKKYELEPIGIAILRLCSDELKYYDLSTGMIKEESHGIYLEEMGYIFLDRKRIVYSDYTSRRYCKKIVDALKDGSMYYNYRNIKDVFIDVDCIKYVREKMLNTKIKVYLEEESYITSNSFDLITDELLEETLDIMKSFETNEIYTNDIYLTRTSHIEITGKKENKILECIAKEVETGGYLGRIKTNSIITKIEIKYILKNSLYKAEYIGYSKINKEGPISEFILE